MKALAIAALLLCPHAGAAVPEQSCGAVDFSARLGRVRQQNGTEWCWASSAADLIGFAQGITPRDQVSVIDVALGGLTITQKNLVAGGLSSEDWRTYRIAQEEADGADAWRRGKQGLRLVKRTGWSMYAALRYNTRERLCLESEIPARPPVPFVDEPAGPPRLPLPKLPGSAALRPLTPTDSSFLVERLRELGDSSSEGPAIPAWQRMLFQCRREDAPLLDSYSDVFREINDAVLEKLDRDVRSRCERGPAVKPMQGEVKDFKRGAGSEAAATAARWLSEGAPLSISIPSGYLRSGWKSDTAASRDWHELVVAGMRWNGDAGRCEFKLRNSYGEKCGDERLRPELAKRCEDGSFWVGEGEMNSLARFATRIRAKP